MEGVVPSWASASPTQILEDPLLTSPRAPATPTPGEGALRHDVFLTRPGARHSQPYLQRSHRQGSLSPWVGEWVVRGEERKGRPAGPDIGNRLDRRHG